MQIPVTVMSLGELRDTCRRVAPDTCGCGVPRTLPNVANWPQQTALVGIAHEASCVSAGAFDAQILVLLAPSGEPSNGPSTWLS
ncbi:hypothetical protein QI633_08175 [Nocardioides sp. QY071]|uniref:hypothetical protein n=1 Tax=Nocardioides sp. QY071 TaxID=3044187 RepID=UPI00249BFD97|nr:hypothetical protein [Nocardioides sp. QY071]WGY03729.1 hypothetical protein QI633_08175 [Nocardioides sp. QY071]